MSKETKVGLGILGGSFTLGTMIMIGVLLVNIVRF